MTRNVGGIPLCGSSSRLQPLYTSRQPGTRVDTLLYDLQRSPIKRFTDLLRTIVTSNEFCGEIKLNNGLYFIVSKSDKELSFNYTRLECFHPLRH